MEINEIISSLSDSYSDGKPVSAETLDQLFALKIAKAQVEAIGILVGALGKIEFQLQFIAERIAGLEK